MSKSFEEFYESWMEEQLYMAGRLWEEEQLILQQEFHREKQGKVHVENEHYEYNQSLPWDIPQIDERDDTPGPDIPFTVI